MLWRKCCSPLRGTWLCQPSTGPRTPNKIIDIEYSTYECLKSRPTLRLYLYEPCALALLAVRVEVYAARNAARKTRRHATRLCQDNLDKSELGTSSGLREIGVFTSVTYACCCCCFLSTRDDSAHHSRGFFPRT